MDATALATISAGIQQLHVYKSADAAATIVASGYFNDVTNRLKQHDVIIVISATGGTPKIDVIFVTSATGAATVTTSATEGLLDV